MATARLARRWLSTSARRYQRNITELESDASSAKKEAGIHAKDLHQNQIDPSKLIVKQTESKKTPLPVDKLVFGHSFTDHMLLIPWNVKSGWAAPQIVPYGPLNLEPSSTVLHYASCLFEGLKAYVAPDKSVRLFRPDKNMERMRTSAARLAFPDFNGEAVIDLMKSLIRLDKHWVPREPGHSLYVRPAMIGTQAALGVGANTDVLLFVIASPVGPYYKTGFKPVSLLATTEYIRAFPGGTGGYKLGANYASGLVPQIEAAEKGYQQILWLLGEDHQLTEVGTMNLFVVLEGKDGVRELVTPPLEDIVLPGVTRDSILTLAQDHASGKTPLEGLPANLKVSVRKINMAEVLEAQREGRLKEVFGAGTAAIVSPVNNIGFKGQDIPIPVGEDGLGDVARIMVREVVGRQYGQIPSDWSVEVAKLDD